MGSPYLNRGESITLTTHRITVESVPYDVMLTSHRLTLIDSRYARFEPLMIAFEDIVTVQSGAASTGEPVIILTYTGADDGVQIMNLIFSQQPGEHRRHERDIWIKKLMEAIIAERDRPATPDNEEPAADTAQVRASIRRWVAPEGVALHTPFDEMESEKPDLTITTEDDAGLFRPLKRPESPRVMQTDVTAPPGIGDAALEHEYEPEPILLPEAPRKTREYDYGITEDESERTPPLPDMELDPLEKFQKITIPFNPAERPRGEGSNLPGDQSLEIPTVSGSAILAGVQSMIPDVEPSITDLGNARIDETAPADTEQAGYEDNAIDWPKTSAIPEGTSEKILSQDAPRQGNSAPEPYEGEAIYEGEQPKSQSGLSKEPARVRVAPLQEYDRTPHDQSMLPTKPGISESIQPRGIITILLVIIGILLLTGAIVLLAWLPGLGGSGPGPQAIAGSTSETIPTPAVLTIPARGAGFHISYPGEYSGYVGSPGRMKGISGSGDTFYPVLAYNDLVQASVQKGDNSGNPLVIEVYNNGRMIYTRNVSTPKGSLDILIDTRTGSVAGMVPENTITAPTTQSRPLYF